MRTSGRGNKRYMAMAVGTLVLSSLLYTATYANAANWSTIASACVPDTTATVSAVASDAAFGTVTFPGDATGAIRLTCPVSGFGRGALTANKLKVSFYDTDNRGAECKVIAVLLRGNFRLERGGELARFDSTESGDIVTENGTNRKIGTVGFTEQINRDVNYYFAMVRTKSDGYSTVRPKVVIRGMLFHPTRLKS